MDQDLYCVNLEDQISKRRAGNKDRDRTGPRNFHPPGDRAPRNRERLRNYAFFHA
jgi:hypothetical protein